MEIEARQLGIRLLTVTFSFSFLVLAHCAPTFVSAAEVNQIMGEKVKKRAAFDFNCKDPISVTPIDERSFGADGCGKRAVYLTSDDACRAGGITAEGFREYCIPVLDSKAANKQ